MLISHVHKFVYLKTVKTGGTSVEIYFEPFCKDPEWRGEVPHDRDQEVSKWGIIGSRGRPFQGQTWYNHMTAASIRALIGPQMWRDYYKFCVVRHPYDKAVSLFWHQIPNSHRAELKNAPFAAVRTAFEEWLKDAELPEDREIYTIGDHPVVNRFVRYESLLNGLAEVCHDLGIAWDASRLGYYKADTRVRPEPFSDYYRASSARRVAEAYRWDFEYFRYSTGLYPGD